MIVDPSGRPVGDRMVCRVCSCTDDHSCADGCLWAEPGICSTCWNTALLLALWQHNAVSPDWEALLVEVAAHVANIDEIDAAAGQGGAA